MAGLSATPASAPASRIWASVRCRCGARLHVHRDRVGAGVGERVDVALGVLDHEVDVEGAAALVDRRRDARVTTGGPIVMLGTKWPSMTSTWIRRAPASITVAISSPRRPKSADRIDGVTQALVQYVVLSLGLTAPRRRAGRETAATSPAANATSLAAGAR